MDLLGKICRGVLLVLKFLMYPHFVHCFFGSSSGDICLPRPHPGYQKRFCSVFFYSTSVVLTFTESTAHLELSFVHGVEKRMIFPFHRSIPAFLKKASLILCSSFPLPSSLLLLHLLNALYFPTVSLGLFHQHLPWECSVDSSNANVLVTY